MNGSGLYRRTLLALLIVSALPVMSLLSSRVYFYTGAPEDLTEFTEVDDTNSLEVTWNRVDFNRVNRMQRDAYLYKEVDGGFTVFSASFTCTITLLENSSSLVNRLNLLTFAKEFGDYRTLKESGKDQLCVRVATNGVNGRYIVELRETYGYETHAVQGDYSFRLGQPYYYTLQRGSRGATLKIYDGDTSSLVERLALPLEYTGLYSVVLFPQSCGYHAGSYLTSGCLENLCIAK